VTNWYQSLLILEKPCYISRLQLQVEAMEKQNIDFGKVLGEIQESLVSLHRAQGDTQAAIIKLDQGVSAWRPQVEAAVQDLHEEVGDLRQQVDLLNKVKQAPPAASSPRVPLTGEERKAPLLPTPTATSPAAVAEGAEKWANGHRLHQNFRGKASGVVTTLIHSLGKGTSDSNRIPF
jgi:hypothetical protein